MEQQAQRQPLFCVFDDLQWPSRRSSRRRVGCRAVAGRADPVALHRAAGAARAAPVLGGGMWNATTVLLEPLDAAETEQLVAHLAASSRSWPHRSHRAADGNPLFLEEMLALVRASPDGRVEVPPTIQALLAARLDQAALRAAVLERGSVEGQLFHRGAVEALANGEPQTERLLALVRKQLGATGPGAASARGRLPIPASPDPRRRLRRPTEERPRRPAPPLRRLARNSRPGPHRARGNPRLPPRAGGPPPRRPRPARRAARRRSVEAPRPHPGDARAGARIGEQRSHCSGAQSLSARTRMSTSWSTSHRASTTRTPRRRSSTAPPSARTQTATRSAPHSPARWRRDAGTRQRVLGRRAGAARLGRTAVTRGGWRPRGTRRDLVPRSPPASTTPAPIWSRWSTPPGTGTPGTPRSPGSTRRRLWTLPLALVHGPRPAGDALAKLDALYPHPWTNLNRAALLAMSDRIEQARTVAGAAEDHLRAAARRRGRARAFPGRHGRTNRRRRRSRRRTIRPRRRPRRRARRDGVLLDLCPSARSRPMRARPLRRSRTPRQSGTRARP